jgi:hypothetical protein
MGAASLFVALAPCLIMCAVGICASRMRKDKPAQVPVSSGPGYADAPVTNVATPDVAAADPPTRETAFAESALPDPAEAAASEGSPAEPIAENASK